MNYNERLILLREIIDEVFQPSEETNPIRPLWKHFNNVLKERELPTISIRMFFLALHPKVYYPDYRIKPYSERKNFKINLKIKEK